MKLFLQLVGLWVVLSVVTTAAWAGLVAACRSHGFYRFRRRHTEWLDVIAAAILFGGLVWLGLWVGSR